MLNKMDEGHYLRSADAKGRNLHLHSSLQTGLIVGRNHAITVLLWFPLLRLERFELGMVDLSSRD